MAIRVSESLNAKVISAVRDALTKDFPGAEIQIKSFRSKLRTMEPALARDATSIESAVSFHGVGSEVTHVTGSEFPVGGGEEFSFKGMWDQARGLVNLALKKLDDIYG